MAWLRAISARLFVPLLLCALLLPVPLAYAQEGAERVLTPGTPVSGVLDNQNVAQVYAFTGRAGDTVLLTARSAAGLGLALLVTDSTGAPLAQAFNTTGALTLQAELSESGTYYVTVLSAIGVLVPTGSTFELTLVAGEDSLPAPAATALPEPSLEEEKPGEEAPEQARSVPPEPVPARSFVPGQVLISSGLQIALVWNATANLDLEVRDPVGGSLRFATPSVNSGGVFEANANALCAAATAASPTERASWPAGAIPTGSYEVIVYYQPLADCPTTEPVDFAINVVLDGQVVEPIIGRVLPNEIFLASFSVGANATVTTGRSGLYTDTTVLPPVPVADLLAIARPIQRDALTEDVLTNAWYYRVYSFTGSASELVSIAMDAVSGSLDTLLLLLDAAGNVIDSNDDSAPGNTNASIVNRRLLNSDTYYIVATRYGKEVGGTEGGYELLLTGPVGDLPQEVIDLGLPRGDVEVVLSWNTNADLQLLVRDPRGDSVYDDIPLVPSGGRLAAGGNVNCRVLQASPVSYIYWPPGTLTPGVYEVEVWYQNPCNDGRPVTFELAVFVDGVRVFSDTASPAVLEKYLTNFTIGVDRSVQTDLGGFIGTSQRIDAGSLDWRSRIGQAVPIVSGQPVTGSITADNKFDLYVFEGRAGDVVSISMIATAGRLDTALFLMDQNGFQLAENDDAVVGESTDSLISEFTLPQDGQYIIIATHFGMRYGGTTGAYSLTFTRLN
ncbi:MAG: pre-peptidase C-terminal domain-containing protein [Aggregatilineales bacterium]